MGATAMLTGTIFSGAGRAVAGNATKANLDSEASAYSMDAGQAIASGIQGAIGERRRASYVASNARALTAASGLTTTGTSAITTVGNIRGEGEYRALTQLYEGEEKSDELNYRASLMRSEGKGAQSAGWLSGISTILSGGSSWWDKYGNGDADALSAAKAAGY
ncbi:MAG TPA: hypothetical protein VFX20_18095 [Steroidobacteraceae bacterium]|nr:hypothetical protein [Steroidobacteraceae bacterium]